MLIYRVQTLLNFEKNPIFSTNQDHKVARAQSVNNFKNNYKVTIEVWNIKFKVYTKNINLL